jgi:DNA ligase (NAD+)
MGDTVNIIKEMKELINKLNYYRNAYYNDNQMLITDKEYDALYDKLEEMEQEVGVCFPNSPTQTVGYEVQSKLNKVEHDHPMLSLAKTKDLYDIVKFADSRSIIGMLKMDGLTCSLSYDKYGDLVKAETRGDGVIGEDILKNAKVVGNIPLHINTAGVPLTVDGEIIITREDFDKINNELPEEERFSHPRNLASGSIRQLDTSITAQRNLKFIAWRVIDGFAYGDFSQSLTYVQNLGFDIVPFIFYTDEKTKEDGFYNNLQKDMDYLQKWAKKKSYPIDGLVYSYEDITYGKTLGMTGHHPKHSVAFKFGDDEYETVLRNIEWSTSRTSQINPVAVFDGVDLDGALTTRATLHNISVIKELELGIGDKITVFRANAVIPKVGKNLTRSNSYIIPSTCPCCGEKAEVRKDGIAEVLYCNNAKCPAKLLSQFVHFVSKPAMNIDGLSESTLEKLIEKGIIKTYTDIYRLENHSAEIMDMEGFGKRSYEKLITSINNSRNVKLENMLVALGIPLIGKTASKTISNYFKGDWDQFKESVALGMDFTILDDFGEAMSQSLYDFAEQLNHHYEEQLYYGLFEELTFIKEENKIIENNFIGSKTFCVTGSFNTMKRSDIEKIIVDRGGKLTGSVSKNTNYLLTNDADSGSSKAVKAKQLNIPIMSEADFLEKIK